MIVNNSKENKEKIEKKCFYSIYNYTGGFAVARYFL